ncbi:MAG: hypothetical protein AB9866_17725 [Syntrophobacteraceae bacterium]
MEWKRRMVLAFSMVAWALSCMTPAAWACGPLEERTLFTDPIRPDRPVEPFLQGRLGIIEPAYRRIYLLSAYRQLVGPALNSGEQSALKAVIDKKLWSETLLFADSPDTGEQEDEEAALKEWLEARRQVKKEGDAPGVPAEAEPRVSDSYHRRGLYFKNCLDDSFRTATKTLGERSRQFGADSVEVLQWLEAQNKVFDNCSGKENLPAPPEQGFHPLIARDRAYQIASAHFYLLDLDKAKEMFEAIGNDSESPWRRVAPYLVGRVMLRKATLAGPGEGGESEVETQKSEAEEHRIKGLLAEAEKQFTSVLEDSAAADLHPSARGLLQLVRSKLLPVESRSRLAEAIMSPAPELGIDKAAADYTVLLDRFMKEHLNSEVFSSKDSAGMSDGEEVTMGEFLTFLDKEHDMTDWILTFQGGGKAGLDRALKKYDEKGSLPWLIAVLSEINSGHPRFASIAAKASQVPKDSPGYGTVSYHLARCAVEAGRRDEAGSMLDALLSHSEKEGAARSTVNHLLTLRLAVADNLKEFIRYTPRVAVRFENTTERPPESPFFDEDSARIINTQMPLRLMLELAQNKTLPERLRGCLGRALWVRSLILGNEAIASAAANLLKESDPALRPHLDAYLGIKDAKARRYAGVFTILRLPGLRPFVDVGRERETPLDEIDSYRDNWWDHPRNLVTEKEGMKRVGPGFIGPEQKSAAAGEYKALTASGSAPTFLCRFIASYGKDKPSAPNLPEALHLAVKSSRYGHVDGDTGKYSKEAFELLHKKYPKSEWAEKTPYWFK